MLRKFILGIALLRLLLLVAALFFVIAWMFRSLTIEVTDEELIWRFGSGWLTKRVRLSEIASAQIVRTRSHRIHSRGAVNVDVDKSGEEREAVKINN